MYGSVSESMSQEVATYGRHLVKLYASFGAAGLSHLCMFQSIIREGALWNYPTYSSTQKQLFARPVMNGGVAILPYVTNLASPGLQPNTDFLRAVVAFSETLKLTLSEEGA